MNPNKTGNAVSTASFKRQKKQCMITQQKKTEIDSSSSRLELHNPSSVSTPPDCILPAWPPAKFPWETNMYLREIELLTRSHHPKIKLTQSKAKREQGKVIHEVEDSCYLLLIIQEVFKKTCVQKSNNIWTDNWFDWYLLDRFFNIKSSISKKNKKIGCNTVLIRIKQDRPGK